MDQYTMTEQAYKNGYNQALKDIVEQLKAHKIKPEFPWDDFFVTETTINEIAKKLLKR